MNEGPSIPPAPPPTLGQAPSPASPPVKLNEKSSEVGASLENAIHASFESNDTEQPYDLSKAEIISEPSETTLTPAANPEGVADGNPLTENTVSDNSTPNANATERTLAQGIDGNKSELGATRESNESLEKPRNINDRLLDFLSRHQSLNGLYKYGAKREINKANREIFTLQQQLKVEEEKLAAKATERAKAQEIVGKLTQFMESMKAESTVPLASNAFDTFISEQVDEHRDVIERIDTIENPAINAIATELRSAIQKKVSRRVSIAEKVSSRFDNELAPSRQSIAEIEQRLNTFSMARVALEIDSDEQLERIDRAEAHFESILRTLAEAGWSEDRLKSNRELNEQRMKFRKTSANLETMKRKYAAAESQIVNQLNSAKAKIAPRAAEQDLFKLHANQTALSTEPTTAESADETAPDELTVSEPEISIPIASSAEQVGDARAEGPPRIREAIMTWNSRMSTATQFTDAEKKSLALPINEFMNDLRGMHRGAHTTESLMRVDRFLRFTAAFLRHKNIRPSVIQKAMQHFKAERTPNKP